MESRFQKKVQLGPPARCPFSPFFGGRVSPLKSTTEQSWYQLIPTSLLEDLEKWPFLSGPLFPTGDLNPPRHKDEASHGAKSVTMSTRHGFVSVPSAFGSLSEDPGVDGCVGFSGWTPHVAWVFFSDPQTVRPSDPQLGETFLTLCWLGESSSTKIDYRKKVGTRILTSLLEDLVQVAPPT